MSQLSMFLPLNTQEKTLGNVVFASSLSATLGSSQPLAPKKGSSPCLVTVLNIASFLGYVPFKIQENSLTGCYNILPLSRLRKGACAITHSIYICLYIGFIQQYTVLSKPKELSSNFLQTFDFVTTIGNFLLTILFVVTFWKCQDQLLKIVEAAKVDFDGNLARMLTATASVIFLVGYITANYIFRNYFDGVPGTSFMFLSLGGERSVDSTLPSVGRALCNVYMYHVLAMTYFSYVFIAMLGVTMRGVGKKFCDRMNDSLTAVDMEMGFDNYMALKELTADITHTFGNQILIYYVISVAYFAKIPESSVWQRTVETTGMIIYFSMGAIVWLLSAEFHMNVRDVIQNWASKMQDLDDLAVDIRIRLLSVVNDILLDPTGVSCKFFTITYGFLGSMLGLIVTYAIIVFQMQTNPQPTSSTGGSKLSELILETLFPSSTTPSTN